MGFTVFSFFNWVSVKPMSLAGCDSDYENIDTHLDVQRYRIVDSHTDSWTYEEFTLRWKPLDLWILQLYRHCHNDPQISTGDSTKTLWGLTGHFKGTWIPRPRSHLVPRPPGRWYLLRGGTDGLYYPAAEAMLSGLRCVECGFAATWPKIVDPETQTTEVLGSFFFDPKRILFDHVWSPFEWILLRYAGNPAFKLEKAWTATCNLPASSKRGPLRGRQVLR